MITRRVGEYKKFMKERGYYPSYVCDVGIRKDYKNRQDWTFRTLPEVLKEFEKYLIDKEVQG